ncbi:UNVERIFIED_CONTAM: putative N-acetyltransferase YhbS [Acetivibrio alkalicellulosi]
MNYSFVIRKATECDASAIHCITKEAFQKYIKDTGLNISLEPVEESLEDVIKDIQTKNVFIGIIDSIPVGSIRISIENEGNAYISRFGVSPKYHNIGIGKAFINVVDKLLLSKNIKRVYLHTASKYKELITFYYNSGFYIHSTSEERGYIRALLVKEYT